MNRNGEVVASSRVPLFVTAIGILISVLVVVVRAGLLLSLPVGAARFVTVSKSLSD
jgi:hypothetical protein